MAFEDVGIDPNRNVIGGGHPLLVIGILIFIAPFFNNFLNINIPNWISTLGIVIILIGAILSIIQATAN